MDENSLFTPFDEITQTRELQMLKTIIPYMPHDSQKQMTLMVHYISLMNSMRMIDCAPALSVAETESMSDRRLSMLNALKKYCSKSEQDTIDNLLIIINHQKDDQSSVSNLWITKPERSFGSNHVAFGGIMLPLSAMSMICFIETG